MKYMGMLRAIQDNNSDGTYPPCWKDFYLIDGDVRVVIEARTGGERDKLLHMTRSAVEVEGGPAYSGLSCGDPATVHVVGIGNRQKKIEEGQSDAAAGLKPRERRIAPETFEEFLWYLEGAGSLNG